MSRKRILAIAAVLVGVLATTGAGCDDDTVSSSSSDTTPTTTAASSSSSSPTTAGSPAPSAVPSVATSVPATGEKRYLSNITVGAQNGKDQVVFRFEQGVPGFDAAYATRSALTDVAGRSVVVDGDEVLRVVLEPASGVELTGEVVQKYKGDKKITPTGTSDVVQLVQISDFEAQLDWAIGTKSQAPFTAVADQAAGTLTFTFE